MNINLISENNKFNNEILIESLKEANAQIIDLQTELENSKWVDNALIERTRLLDKRVRELNCIFSIIEIIKQDQKVDKLFKLISNIIPEGFQTPEMTCVLLKIMNMSFYSENFTESPNFHLAKKNDRYGNEITLQVFHKDRNNLNNFFLPDEINLINYIIDLLNLFLCK